MNHVKDKKRETSNQPTPGPRLASRELKPIEDLTAYIQEYARQRPETVALTCIGIGFVLGWKLKLW
jgi:hypothetical protein